MNIRHALKSKLQGSSANDLKTIIQDGIDSQEEAILPGLGVLFESYYESLETNKKDEFVQAIASLL